MILFKLKNCYVNSGSQAVIVCESKNEKKTRDLPHRNFFMNGKKNHENILLKSSAVF